MLCFLFNFLSCGNCCLQSVNREAGEVAPADVKVVAEGARQRPQRYPQRLLPPAGDDTQAQGEPFPLFHSVHIRHC